MPDRNNLLLISLGPVQDFIATARKCQDLWYGSYLLSQLAKAAAEALPGEALIFPGNLHSGGEEEEEGGSAVANKILALLPPGTEPRFLAEEARKNAKEKLHQLAQDNWPDPDDTYFQREVALQQLEEFLEFFWVSVPLKNEDYAKARERAEQLLASRKNTRDWSYMKSADLAGSGVPKSSLDGARESVIHEDAYRAMEEKRLFEKYRIKKGERLCGISLLKRLGSTAENEKERRPPFHSTSHMAAAPLLVRFARARVDVTPYIQGLKSDAPLEDNRIRCGKTRFSSLLTPPAFFSNVQNTEASSLEIPRTFGQTGQWGYDGVLFFEDRLLPDVFPETEAPPNVLNRHKRALKALLKKAGVNSPFPYYAVLIADGDKMGAFLDHLAHQPNPWKIHKDFSIALEGFASSVRDWIEGYGGNLVYSGGDDVFALLPLHSALDAADRLRREFQKMCHAFLEEKGLQTTGLTLPTLSVGLAFVHHLTSLYEAREHARNAERAAKDQAGRNALGIVMDKRSGVTLTLWGKWEPPEGKPNLLERLLHWAELLKNQEMPHGLAYELDREIALLEVGGEMEEKKREEFGPVLKALAKRVIGRKKSERGKEPVKKEVADQLLSTLDDLGEDPFRSVRRLSREIQVARLLLQAYETAWGPLP